MRVARCSVAGLLTHIIFRLVDRQHFIEGAIERTKYLELLEQGLQHSDWRCVSFALMSNHIHLGMIPGEMELESWTKRVNSPFARWINIRRDGLGPVFADRPAEWAMRPANHPRLIAYIHNNPVRAKLVRRASASTWTSHRMYLGRVAAPPWLAVEEGLKICGFDASTTRAFDQWVNEQAGIELDEHGIVEVRKAVRSRGSLEIGTPIVGVRTEVPLVVSEGARVRISPCELLECVADVMQVAVGEICSRSTRRPALEARRVAVHAARRAGLRNTEIATVLGISPQAVGQHADAALTTAQEAALDSIERRMCGDPTNVAGRMSPSQP
jgi:REP element-mobilizing transposase RayT